MITVLYVDDEPGLLKLGKLFLEQGGMFRISTAESGESALVLLKKSAFDAVVSDFQMPLMNGITLLREIRSTSDIPFILFTGKGREEVVIDAINSGADFYLQKGGDPAAQFAELGHKIKPGCLPPPRRTGPAQEAGDDPAGLGCLNPVHPAAGR